MLPLDLHVLSLSLAFILSQDQTLRCSNCFMSLLKIPLFQVQVFFDGIHSKYLYYCCICKFLKELFSIVSFETWCKGKDFYFYLPNFFEVFFRFIFPEDFRANSDICLDSSNLILFPLRVLSPSPSCRLTHLSRLRVQKYCFITYPPNLFATFFYLFFAFPDCQGVMNTLFLFRSFGLTQKNQKVKATLRRLQISFPPLKSRITRATRSDSRDFFTLRSQFALRLLR